MLDTFILSARVRPALVVIMVFGGLAAMLAAVTGFAAGTGRSPTASASRTSLPAPVSRAPIDSGFALDSAGVFVDRSTYVPGQATSWHTHTGIHVVAVLSGTLTVYDETCHARTYGVGETYVSDTSLHMARNESDAPVEMIITYLPRAGTTIDQFTISSGRPAGC